jgi:SAM-dependent methyltransferase
MPDEGTIGPGGQREQSRQGGGEPLADRFVGSVPALYDALLVPMIFAPYAADLAERVQRRSPSTLLELAAGTGAVTRALAERLPGTASLVATDLSQPMLDRAARIGTRRPVTWQQADAMHLPFSGATFEAVVCQFGVMFFPDRAHAYREVRAVLRPGGAFVFNTWDRIEANEFAETVERALGELYPEAPPRFMSRTPHGYFDPRTVKDDLARAGFGDTATISPLAARARAESARIVAEAYCQGTPLRAELEARGPNELARATDASEAALSRRFGGGAVEGALNALVVEVNGSM